MQKLAFEVLESTRNFPFKLPSDAIYILRVSAHYRRTWNNLYRKFQWNKRYFTNFTKNIPKTLGSDSIVETIIDEIKSIPLL